VCYRAFGVCVIIGGVCYAEGVCNKGVRLAICFLNGLLILERKKELWKSS